VSSLDDLFVETAELDRELIGTVLKPYLVIDRSTLAIRPQARWRTASNRARIIAYLLARKAMRAHGAITPDAERVPPGQIINATGLPRGSVYPTLKELYEARPQAIDKDSRANYWVPDWGVQAACEILQEGNSAG
jgi:hypothetical protein